MENISLNRILAYAFSLNATTGCYFYTLMKMKRGNQSFIRTITHIQQVNAQRELIVLFRRYILLGLLSTISIPVAVGYFIYASSIGLP